MARKGAAGLHRGDDEREPLRHHEPSPRPEGDWAPEQWARVDERPAGGAARPSGPRAPRRSGDGVVLRDQATGSGTAPGGHRHSIPARVVSELEAAAGGVRGPRLAARLADATYAYERERYEEARRILRPLADEVPDAGAVRELLGLVLYRSGEWAAAIRHLEAHRRATGSFDQHPVLADCYRALRRYGEADGLWEELRAASPDGDLVAEGRIVAAGCLADQGDLRGAIGVLERSARRVEHPRDRHLRQWYALADLYERAGDLPKARDLFARLASASPDAFDVRQRIRALR